MPSKIRDLERQLKRAGFVQKKERGKGSHRVFKHPRVRAITVIISGHPGKDASPYQEEDVAEALSFVQAQLGESID